MGKKWVSGCFEAVLMSTEANMVLALYVGEFHGAASHQETRLHNPSLSWQEIANLCIEAALTSEDIMALAYRRMPVFYWTSGGCQSVGPSSPVGDRYSM